MSGLSDSGVIAVNAPATPDTLAALSDRGYTILAAHGAELIAKKQVLLRDFHTEANQIGRFVRFASWFADGQPLDWRDLRREEPDRPSFPSSAKITFR